MGTKTHFQLHMYGVELTLGSICSSFSFSGFFFGVVAS